MTQTQSMTPTFRHQSEIVTFFLDEADQSHGDPRCPRITGQAVEEAPASGWLCSTCIDVEPRHERPGVVIESTDRFEKVTNGFGGTTTRRPSGSTEVVPPTPKQLAFVRTLLAERAGVPAAEALREVLNRLRTEGSLSKRAVSATIDALLKIARPQAEASDEPTPVERPAQRTAKVELPDVPAGRYAVENEDGELRFYVVDRPMEGKWAGWTFVKVQASDELHPIKGMEAKAVILAKIALDPQAASIRYGQELGVCGVCNRTLTDEESRRQGIGPVCRAKMAW